MHFTNEPLQTIIPILEAELTQADSVSFTALDPDLFENTYAGTPVTIEGSTYLYRSLRAWVELADLLGCRMRVPEKVGASQLRITYEKLAKKESFHTDNVKRMEEKYGSDSVFAKIHKMEEPSFFYYYRQALENANITQRKRILDLGINRGDEFEVIEKMVGEDHFSQMELAGIDHSQSALAEAKEHFTGNNVRFYSHDINELDALELGRFDLLISIGTLQSPGINYKTLLMDLVQNHLSDDAALILGFPNGRWMGGELLYGAKVPHYAMSEMGLVLSDVIFAKKYLQQKKFRVTVTGKQYLFVTATKIGSK